MPDLDRKSPKRHSGQLYAASSQSMPANQPRSMTPKTYPSQSIRLLHILGELKPSGAEVMYHAAAEMWRREGIHGEILSIGQTPGAMAAVLEADGYRIHHLPFSKSPLHLLRVYRLLLRNRFDVVHIDVERGNFWYGLLAFLAATPRTFRTVHSVFAFNGFLKARRRWQRRLLRLLGLTTISIGDSVFANELQTFGNPTLRIPNWFDNRRFVPPTAAERQAGRARLQIANNSLVLVSIGNCAPLKNHAAILRALATLPANSPTIYLHVGTEDLDHSERGLAAELGVTEKVIFHGFAEDVVPLLHAADVYVMPSCHEGFSCAVLEALGSGLPAILSDVPGLRDIGSVWTGVCWTGISPESIANAVLSVHRMSAEQRREIGLQGSDAIHRNFGIENGARKYAELYKTSYSGRNARMRIGRLAVGDKY
jgi:glycosyltransferase involved in cell wall biosynthesis